MKNLLLALLFAAALPSVAFALETDSCGNAGAKPYCSSIAADAKLAIDAFAQSIADEEVDTATWYNDFWEQSDACLWLTVPNGAGGLVFISGALRDFAGVQAQLAGFGTGQTYDGTYSVSDQHIIVLSRKKVVINTVVAFPYTDDATSEDFDLVTFSAITMVYACKADDPGCSQRAWLITDNHLTLVNTPVP